MKNRILQFNIFKELSKNNAYLEEILQILKPLTVPKNTNIIQEGEIGEVMYFLLKGAIEIQKRTLSGHQYTFTKLNSDQNIYFGEMALVDNDKRSATVIALENCELLSLSRKDFMALGDREPMIGWLVLREIAKVLTHRLRTANEDSIVIFETLVKEISKS